MPGWHGPDWSYDHLGVLLEREKDLADDGWSGYADMRGIQAFIVPVERLARVSEILREAYEEDVHD